MAKVLPLSAIARMVAVNSLVNDKESSVSLCSLLATDIYAPVSEGILKVIVCDYPGRLTNELLASLCPPHIRQLSLSQCVSVSVTGITAVLSKCPHMSSVDLSGCDQLMHTAFFMIVNRFMGKRLTTLSLEKNSHLCDEQVRAILLHCEGLKVLNLSNTKITDDAFNLSPHSQGEVIPACRLISIDVSMCHSLSLMAVCYICQLWGPTLQHINISLTEISCIALCCLAGYDAKDTVQMMKLLTALERRHTRHSNRTETQCEEQSKPNKGENILTDCPLTNFTTPQAETTVAENKSANGATAADISDHMSRLMKECENTDGNNLLECEAANSVVEPDTIFKATLDADKVPLIYKDPNDPGVQVVKETLCVHTPPRDVTLPHPTESHAVTPENSDTTDSTSCKAVAVCDSEHTAGNDHVTIKQEAAADLTTSTLSDCSECVSTGADGESETLPRQMYTPCLNRLEINCIYYVDKSVFDFCLKLVCLTNPGIQRLELSYKQLSDQVLEYMVNHTPQLRHVSLCECEQLTSQGVSTLCSKCPNLAHLSLYGVCFIDDSALLPLWTFQKIKYLNLAECNISDASLKMMSLYAPQLEEVNLSWCDELIQSDDTTELNNFILSASSLQSVKLRHLPLSARCVMSLAETCVHLSCLNLSSVGCVSDGQVLALTLRCTQLQTLDVGWNSDLTDISARAILTHLIYIKELVLSGIKQLTSKPFVPIIADLSRWGRCQALLRLKLHERQLHPDSGDSSQSSDEELEELYMPHRSTSYAPYLRHLSLEYCDKQNDHKLAEIAAVCRNTLCIIDYYGSNIEPCYITCQRGKVYKAVQYLE